MERAETSQASRAGQPIEITRRRMLRGVGCVLGSMALPFRFALGAQQKPATTSAEISPVMQRLSAYMSDAREQALPAAVIEQAKLHILDTLAAMVSGSQLLPGQAAIQFAREQRGAPVASVAASDVVCSPMEAALANGVLAHSDETDDSHAPSQSHPGCAVVPAALAAAERFGIGGAQLVRAVTLGYDVGPRVSIAVGGGEFQTRSHRDTHSLAGGFGAAAAAACAAGLNAQQMRWVLDYAAQQSAGIAAWQRDPQHMEKAFVFAGMPARNGVTAALLVHAGWTGVEDIFSGPDNFLEASTPNARPEALVDQLGIRYEVTRTNIKKWCVGSPIQAPLDALEALQKKHSLKADQVARVTVRVATREAAVVDNRTLPDICLQHMIAVMLVNKTVSFRSAHDQMLMQDPAVLRQRAKVELVPDAALEAHLPRREAIVEVTLIDGTRFTEHVEAVRGSADNPMDREEVVSKSTDLMTPVLGSQQCSQLVSKVLGIEELKDTRELRPWFTLRKPPKHSSEVKQRR